MCRYITFSGKCTRCVESFTWDDLSQELLCLEAKNNGWLFGECRRGIVEEHHDFDRKCERCLEESNVDEEPRDGGDDEEIDAEDNEDNKEEDVKMEEEEKKSNKRPRPS